MTISEPPVRRRYPSDVTDEEWAFIKGHIPSPIWITNLQEPQHHPREILNAIRYRARNGIGWRALPHDLPPWSTVFKWYQKWTASGALDRLHDELRRQVREAAGREADPTAAILDSQSVKSTDVGGPRGFDAGKKGEGPQAPPAGRRPRAAARRTRDARLRPGS